MRAFAMGGHEIFGVDQGQHQAELLPRRMAGAMEREGQAILLDVGPQFDEVVDQTIDQSPVPRNRIGGEDDGVARHDLDVAVLPADDPT